MDGATSSAAATASLDPAQKCLLEHIVDCAVEDETLYMVGSQTS